MNHRISLRQLDSTNSRTMAQGAPHPRARSMHWLPIPGAIAPGDRCNNSECPVWVAHHKGRYNFDVSIEEARRSRALPMSIVEILADIDDWLDDCLLDYQVEEWLDLAQFAVVHQSFREPLMPRSITERAPWNAPMIQNIIAREPLITNAEVIFIDSWAPVALTGLEYNESICCCTKLVNSNCGISKVRQSSFLLMISLRSFSFLRSYWTSSKKQSWSERNAQLALKIIWLAIIAIWKDPSVQKFYLRTFLVTFAWTIIAKQRFPSHIFIWSEIPALNDSS